MIIIIMDKVFLFKKAGGAQVYQLGANDEEAD